MSDRPLALMLIDDDPVFRLGLRIWVEQSDDLVVVAEASNGHDALEHLQQCLTPSADTDLEPVQLVILDIGLGKGDPEAIPGLRLCQEIKTRFPGLPVLILSAQAESVLQTAARQVGANGFGLRGMPIHDLAELIRQVAQQQDSQQLITALPPPTPPRRRVSATTQGWRTLRRYLRQSSLRRIDANLTELAQTATLDLSWWQAQVLAGQQRELRAARQLIQVLLATPDTQRDLSNLSRWDEESTAPLAVTVSSTKPRSTPAASTGALRVVTKDPQTVVLDAVFRNLQSPLENCTATPLEIDILRVEKRRELLYITLRKFEDILEDLRHAQVTSEHLAEKVPDILVDLWQRVVADFFGKYYTLDVNNREQAVVMQLLQDVNVITDAILKPLPQVPILLGHLLFQDALVIDGGLYLATTPEALTRSQQLLENVLIQLGNAVMQPLLNRYADIESIKNHFYHRRLMSTREIERFRNDLSWRYRWDHLVNEPRAIFESEHRLFILTQRGVEVQMIYASRREELTQLSGAQYALTLALEARDAIAPRFRAVFSLVGSSLVYVLTEVVGRGIGLVGRGILQGIGSAWQESRQRRERQDQELGR